VPVLADAPAEQVAVYAVIAALPLLLGAVNAIDAVVFPAVAAPMVGAPGAELLLPPPPQALRVSVMAMAAQN
jgi:hypothetical protein